MEKANVMESVNNLSTASKIFSKKLPEKIVVFLSEEF